MSMLTTHQLTKTYPGGIQALRGVDLEIGAGMFGLLGPNGAGKTTLMRILAGLLHASSGGVEVMGEDLTSAKGRRAVKSFLGYLPQSFGFYPELTGWEFLEYVAILKHLSDARRRRQQIDELLTLLNLTGVARRRLKMYSGGMKRRLGIAQALLGNPRLLIVDEPSAGLDPEERVNLRNLLGETARRCTVILSTHIVEDISQSCSDLAVIWEGKVLFHGPPHSLIQQAHGRVWHLQTRGEAPAESLAVVSTVQTQSGTRYRVLGEPAPGGGEPLPAEPTLEDGYIWLMRQRRGN